MSELSDTPYETCMNEVVRFAKEELKWKKLTK